MKKRMLRVDAFGDDKDADFMNMLKQGDYRDPSQEMLVAKNSPLLEKLLLICEV